MKVVKDAMVLIHLAKITLLEKSCDYFKTVMIPFLVVEEAVTEGKRLGYDDALLIERIIVGKKIIVKTVSDMKLLELAYQFNIGGGEAEAFALYKQEKADVLISDDYNLRKRKDSMNVAVIGSLAVLLKLRKDKKIDQNKFRSSINTMREIGWFSNAILDKVLMEGENNV